MRRIQWVVTLLLLAGLAAAQSGTSAEQKPKAMRSLDLDAMDRSVEPCQDFFQYACGRWNANNPVPADKTRWGRFDELREYNLFTLRDILEKSAAASPKRTAVEQKIGDYFASCMDEDAIDKKGLAPIQADLKLIAGAKAKSDLTRVLIRLHDAGVNALFAFRSAPQLKNSSMVGGWADQGGLGLPNRDFYFKDDPKSEQIRKQYQQHVENMLKLLGDTAEKAAAGAASIMKLETALAKVAQSPVERRNPKNLDNWMKRGEFAAMTPSLAWDKYFEGVGAPAMDALNVGNPKFFQGLEEQLNATDVEALKTYLRWKVVSAATPFLPRPYQDENFDFFQHKLNGAKEMEARWKRCVRYVDNDLGEALGQKYVEAAFGGGSKERTLSMVHALERALEKDINELDWMGPETKKRALEKLHAITNMIGYPDQWRDYSKLEIVRGDALGNSLRANIFEGRRQLAKIGKPVDKKEWGFTPPTVNAGYSALLNRISFPAGILQPPFFDNEMDDAVNFGAIGAVIGHELTHGFDDQGRRFDPQGNLRDWWTEEDGKEFEKRAQCVIDQYSEYVAVDDVKLNGRLTTGENVADNGGLRIALMALLAGMAEEDAKPIDGFTPEQRLFLGWGQVWCQNVTPERARTLAATDPHSPGQYRVNGVVSNMPEFQKAFSCKKDSPMVRENACRVW